MFLSLTPAFVIDLSWSHGRIMMTVFDCTNNITFEANIDLIEYNVDNFVLLLLNRDAGYTEPTRQLSFVLGFTREIKNPGYPMLVGWSRLLTFTLNISLARVSRNLLVTDRTRVLYVTTLVRVYVTIT
jgi:hypothetical protein